jgi:PAS domain S-box-containing protein
MATDRSPPPAPDEAALARARLEELRHAASDAVMLFDASGTILDANGPAVRAYGDPREELVGRSIFELRADADEARRQFATVLRDGEVRFTTRHRRADGTTTPVDVVSRRVVADGRVVVQSVVHDRGEHEALMDRLLASEERYRATFEEAPVGLTQVGLDLRILGANAKYAELVGRAVPELVGRPLASVVHPEDAPLDAEDKEALLRGAVRSFASERRFVRPSGEVRMGRLTVALRHHPDGTPAHFIGIVEDVTELRAAQRELEARRLVHAQILRTARDAIHVIDVDRRLREWNPAFEAHLGRPASELRGLRVDDWDVGLGGEALADHFRRLEREPLQFRTKHRRADGSVRDVEVEAAPLRVRGETLIYASARDITDRLRLAAAVGARDRMVTVGTLAAGVGHEINNPLSAILTNLELIAEEVRAMADASPSDRLREMAEMVRDAKEGADRVRRIVRGLRTFTRGARVELAEIELPQALDGAVRLAMNELRTAASVVTAWGPCPTVVADESHVAQIFVNLLVNAAHALAARPMDENVIHLATRTSADGRAVVEIADNGPGMTPEVAARAFEPFFTTKPVGQGTGLGLSIVHNLVAGMGATIELRTAPGAGATFTLTFAPRAGVPSPVAPPEPVDVGAPRRARVLVIDDEPSVGTAFERLLAADDVTVETSPAAGLARIERGEDFDVVFCDIVMAMLSGPELYRRVAAVRPALAERFVFITGAITHEATRAFLAAVPNEHVEKPFQVRALRALVRRMAGAAPAGTR